MYVSIAAVTIITGVLIVHYMMYDTFTQTSSCYNWKTYKVPLDGLKITSIVIYGIRTFQDLLIVLIFIWLFLFFYKMKKILLSEDDQALTCRHFLNMSLVALIVLFQVGNIGLKMTEPFKTAEDVC